MLTFKAARKGVSGESVPLPIKQNVRRKRVLREVGEPGAGEGKNTGHEMKNP